MSSCSARASRSATAAGPIRGGATTRATASPRSTRCMRSSRSSRSGAGGSTVFAGAITPTGSRVAPQARAERARSGDRHRRRRDDRVSAQEDLRQRARALGARDQEAGGGDGADRGRRCDQDARRGFHASMPRPGRSRFCRAMFRRKAQAITAGFEFDVPVRFDTDKLEVSLSGFRARRHSQHPHRRDPPMKQLPAGARRASRDGRHDALLVLAAHAARRRRARLHRSRPRPRLRRHDVRGGGRVHGERDQGCGGPERRQSRGDERAFVGAAGGSRSRGRPLRRRDASRSSASTGRRPSSAC